MQVLYYNSKHTTDPIPIQHWSHCYILLYHKLQLKFWYHITCYFPYVGANFPKWWTLSFSKNLPDLEFHNPNNQINSCKLHFTQNSYVYTSFQTPVNRQNVCKLAQYSQSICIALHNKCIVWPDPLLCRVFIACSISTHTSYFIVSSCYIIVSCCQTAFSICFVVVEKRVWWHSQYRVVSESHDFRGMLIGKINTTLIYILFVILLFSVIVWSSVKPN